jgi:hypothetical protein
MTLDEVAPSESPCHPPDLRKGRSVLPESVFIVIVFLCWVFWV